MVTWIGLDLGSSSLKGALLQPATHSVGSVQSVPFPEPMAGLPPACFEVDPRLVVARTRELLDQLIATAGECSGILLSSQMGGILLTDEDGEPRSNYLSWRDQRTTERLPGDSVSCLEKLLSATAPADLAAIGNEIRPGSAVSLLYWLAQTGRLPRDVELYPQSLGEYVTGQLTGRRPRLHPTLALGVLDLQRRQIHQDWLNRLGLNGLRWSELAESGEAVGRFAARSGQSIPIYPAVGDQQAALWGVAVRPGDLSLNVSTGAQVSLVAERASGGAFQTRPYFHGAFLHTITHLPAGRSLNALVDLLGELAAAEGHPVQDPWGAIRRATERVPQTDLDVNLAFFAGTIGDHGHVRNVRLENLSVGHLFRAACEHMADNFVQCAARLAPGKDWKRIVVSGGLPQRLPALREALERRFPGPLCLTDVAEETLTGLARLAAEIEPQTPDSSGGGAQRR